MLIGQHRFRFYYFFGRLLSYSLAGLLAGELGAVLHIYLKKIHFAETLSIFLGIVFVVWGLSMLNKSAIPLRFPRWPLIQRVNEAISKLLLKDLSWATFLFGFFTVLLPCGQTLIVFAACALVGDPLVGLFNGFALALLTSPSLLFAMHLKRLLPFFRTRTDFILAFSTIAVGVLTLCRGLAEMGLISHWTLNEEASPFYHLVLF